jgi:hypothetical protein
MGAECQRCDDNLSRPDPAAWSLIDGSLGCNTARRWDWQTGKL